MDFLTGLHIVLIAVLVIASAYDFRWRRIPNWLTFPSLLAAIIYHSVNGGLEGLFLSIQGAGVGMGVLIVFYILGGLGAGDVKLMGAIGALLGPWEVFNVFLFTAFLGGAYALMVMAYRGFLTQAIKRYWLLLVSFILTRRIIDIPSPVKKGTPSLCYGVVIAIGTLSFLVTGGIL